MYALHALTKADMSSESKKEHNVLAGRLAELLRETLCELILALYMVGSSH